IPAQNAFFRLISRHLVRPSGLEGPPVVRDSPSPAASRGNRENLRPRPALHSRTTQVRPEPRQRVFSKDAPRPVTVAYRRVARKQSSDGPEKAWIFSGYFLEMFDCNGVPSWIF